MSRSLIAVSSILVLAAGCRHSNVPALPASHGHLSQALDDYLDLRTEPPSSPTLDTPEVVVEPDQAPAVFEEAVQSLKGTPTEPEVRQASADLTGACEASFQKACDFIKEQFKGPKRIAGDKPKYPPAAIATKTIALVVVRCRLGVDGKLRACDVLEMGPLDFTKDVLASLQTARYEPALLAGHPIEIPFVVYAEMKPQGVTLTADQKLQWIRMRVERFPESPSAWLELARELAKQFPEDPGYVAALQHVKELDFRHWWSSNELAWTYVQARRYSEAAPLVRRALKASPLNAYVLETSAATQLGLGRCEEAIAEQQRAVEGLPAPWPAPERERFQRTLQEYTQRCPKAGPAPTAPQPR